MELPNSNLQSANFSLLNAFDSEILGPSYSLSILSEPPELRNWFASYKYESPVLDSDDKFVESAYEEREFRKESFFVDNGERRNEKSLRGFEEKGKKDEVEVHVGDDKGEKQSSTESIDSYYLPSLPSEPIDVKNWFSSYVYESPALHTSDGFKDSLYRLSQCEENGLIVEESNGREAEGYGEFKRTRTINDLENSNGLGNHGNYCRDNQQEKQFLKKDDPKSGEEKHVLSDKSNICYGSTLKQCSDYKTLQNHGINPAKEVELSSLDQEDPRRILNLSREIYISPLDQQRRACSSDRELLQKVMCRMENVKDSEAKGLKEGASHLSLRSNRETVLVNKPTRGSIHGCKDKENSGKEVSKDGFVTTRKGRSSKENVENLKEISKDTGKRTVSKTGSKDSVVKRKALSERTNFNLSGVSEITGKWQCPQKRKPNLGPPLKQLRLEQWLRRV